MHEDESIDELPRSLVEKLKAADRGTPVITARVDREIAALAERHFAGRRRARGWRTALTAVAASVLVAVLVLQWPLPAPEGDASLYADVDGSGRIDIADVLARAREQGPDARSRAALDAFAYRIVALDPSGDRT